GVTRGIGDRRSLGVIVGRRLLGADQRDLEGPPRPRPQVAELLRAHAAPPSEALHDDGSPERELLARLVAERDGPAAELVESVERVNQVAEERVAPLLAVGDHIEPRRLLERDGLVHGLVLDALEHGRVEATGLEALSRLDQRRRPQQASDHVAPDGHGPLGVAPRSGRAIVPIHDGEDIPEQVCMERYAVRWHPAPTVYERAPQRTPLHPDGGAGSGPEATGSPCRRGSAWRPPGPLRCDPEPRQREEGPGPGRCSTRCRGATRWRERGAREPGYCCRQTE